MERFSNNGEEELSGFEAKMAQKFQFLKQRDANNVDIEAESKWREMCRLGVSSQVCSRQRFLECYNSWFTKLLPVLKQQTDPDFVRSAALASTTDIIVRLGAFVDVQSVRRDVSQLISKIIQSLLHLIGNKDTNALRDEAMDLLIAVLKYFPNCLRPQSANVEVSLVARLVDPNCPASIRQKCAKALAFLPKAQGDAASWSSLMRRVLIAINADLDFAFRGMEDASVAEGATRALLPVGQDPPRPLGDHSFGLQPGKNLRQQLLPRLISLLQCCNYLLISPYPTPVPAPVGPLMALVMRILRVDGSRTSLDASLFFSQQASLRSELLALHLSALELLSAALRGVRGQLLPRGAALANLLTDHFRHTGGRYPDLRIKLYATSRDLFIAMGAGMVSALAPTVVGSAFSDLKDSSSREHPSSNATKETEMDRGSQGVKSKKRKAAGGSPGDHLMNGHAEVDNTEDQGRASLAVQVAALQALEALLNTGGALLPERWRAEVDAVIAGFAIRVAADTTSFNLSCDDDSSYSRSARPASISMDLQVAAYQALLASLLAPCGHRPPYLAQGFALFRNGRKEVGTEVAAVCVRALAALEPLIHPRCLPPAYNATGTGMNGVNQSGYSGLVRGSENGTHGGSSMKIGHLDPWAVVDTWLGYGEDSADDPAVLPHTDRTASPLNGAAERATSGNGAAERATSGNGAANGGSAADRVTVEEEAVLTKTSEPGVMELVEDPMETETEIAVPASNSPVRETDNVLENVTSVVPDPTEVPSGSPSDQGHVIQPPSVTNVEEAPVPTADLVVVSTDVVTSTSMDTTKESVMITQENQEISVETRTVVEVTTTTASASEQKSTSSKPIELGSDSDSDGPLPAIVDGDPDSDSD